MVSSTEADDFFKAEQLCNIVEPRCGSCRCGKCPVPGSRYSFREQTELQLINDNLWYDEQRQSWVAQYPFLYPRESLLGTKSVAMKSMISTERTLMKNPEWGMTYH